MFKFLFGIFVGVFLLISHIAAAAFGAHIVDLGYKTQEKDKKKTDNPVDLS